jgi:hypothetical protein
MSCIGGRCCYLLLLEVIEWSRGRCCCLLLALEVIEWSRGRCSSTKYEGRRKDNELDDELEMVSIVLIGQVSEENEIGA